MAKCKTQRERQDDLVREAKYMRRRQVQKIKEAKGELIQRANVYRDNMDKLIKKLTEGMDHPESYAHVNVVGELQNVSEFEARVGRLFERVVAYNDSEIIDTMIEELSE